MKVKRNPKMPIQFDDVRRANWDLSEALGVVPGSTKNVIAWKDPQSDVGDLLEAVKRVNRANAAAREAVENIERRRVNEPVPDMAPTVELRRTLNAIAQDIPLDRTIWRATESARHAARKLRYEGGDATVDRQAWRISMLRHYAKNWRAAAERADGDRREVSRAVADAWALVAEEREREGENDAAVETKRRLYEAEQEEKARRLKEAMEEGKAQAERKRAEAEAEAAREATAVEEAIRRHNAPLRSVRDGAKRKYLINVRSAKGETDATGSLKRETFAIEGRVWWPLGVSRGAEDDGKGGYRATTKREWSISFLPVGQQVGSAFSVKEAEDMAKTLAPRFREVENIGEIRSNAPSETAPLARIVNEYDERKRIDVETAEREQAERKRLEAERKRLEAERGEAERAEAERAEAERAEATERLRKQAEREQEKRALYEQGARDYAARTETEHREQREHERKQREREREREREWSDREREREKREAREDQELRRRERRDKAADKATMTRSWNAVDNAKDLASWLEALERIDRQARADGGPGASASVLIDGLPLGLDVLVFALGGENEEVVQATFDEVAIQNPQFARVLRRAMVAQKGKVSAAMLASSLRRRATLAKQTELALGPPEPVSQGVKAPKRRNLARNVAELGLRMLAMRKEPQRGPAYLPDSAPGASSEGRTGRKARKKSEDMAKKKKSETETEKPAKPAKPPKPKKEGGQTGVSVRVGNLYRVVVGRELVDAEVIGRDEGGWILRRLPFATAARTWEEGRQLRGRRSTEELKQCACVFDKENDA